MRLQAVLRSLLLIFLTAVSPAARSHDLSAYIQVSGAYLDVIPEGSLVQGSADHGGIQPDYIIDFKSTAFDELRQYIQKIKADPQVDFLTKINRLSRAVSSLLEKKMYEDKANYLLAQMYKDDGKKIPLSEYAHHRAGVCREHALILNQALTLLGVNNHFVYAKIERELTDTKLKIEDHAFNTILYEGKEWVIDSYFSSFNGFSFQDLLTAKSHPERLPGFPDYIGPRRIIHLNSFPSAWIPKSSPTMRCEWIFSL